MSSRRLTTGIFCAALLSNALFAGQKPDSTSTAAWMLWEKAVAAKGGRDRLHAIENFLITEFDPKTHRTEVASLYVFPNRFWWWSDGRPSPVGVQLNVSDGTGTWRAYGEVGKKRDARGVVWFPPGPYDTFNLIEDEARFLLETRLLRPKAIMSTGTARIGKEELDTLTVDFGIDKQFQFTYYIDRKTFLVRRITQGPDRSKPSLTDVDFDGYTIVDGLMMASRMTRPGFGTVAMEYGFNVQYDAAIFLRKPAIEDGPNGWKMNN